MDLSPVFNFINSPDNSPLSQSVCSSGLIPALLVLSTTYLFIKVSLSPDIILCGWLGLKHQLTDFHTALRPTINTLLAITSSSLVVWPKLQALACSTASFSRVHQFSQLVTWCSEPSQPQRLTSGLETNVNPPPTCSAQKSWNRKILQNPQDLSRHKWKTKHTNTKHRFSKKWIAYALNQMYL